MFHKSKVLQYDIHVQLYLHVHHGNIQVPPPHKYLLHGNIGNIHVHIPPQQHARTYTMATYTAELWQNKLLTLNMSLTCSMCVAEVKADSLLCMSTIMAWAVCAILALSLE